MVCATVCMLGLASDHQRVFHYILTQSLILLRYVDPIKERRLHRRTHGKIEFST
jgi:hypothetical protein